MAASVTAGAAISQNSARNFSSALKGGAAMSLGLNSPKGLVTPINFESMPAFSVQTTKGIPDKAHIRTSSTSRNRFDSLMKVPSHKVANSKFDPTQHVRSIAPLTSEDIKQFGNLGLMSTLRSQQPSLLSGRTQSVAIDSPPSFYEDDLRKKQERFG